MLQNASGSVSVTPNRWVMLLEHKDVLLNHCDASVPTSLRFVCFFNGSFVLGNMDSLTNNSSVLGVSGGGSPPSPAKVSEGL